MCKHHDSYMHTLLSQWFLGAPATDQANSDVLWKEGAVIDARETLLGGSCNTSSLIMFFRIKVNSNSLSAKCQRIQ
jgi:hypothetical protein